MVCMVCTKRGVVCRVSVCLSGYSNAERGGGGWVVVVAVIITGGSAAIKEEEKERKKPSKAENEANNSGKE
ncbi:hypothetical protein P168DRAFT_23584 [Aspergillus campestris IBT 28561]|uniref:Uncharacterized protein n=1 Tax=Aspergillus campestris (strain IBT 28561) TaxID=1392248 RepID=A0A2I1DG22_ASPC2|nr:uncharacterized protein P168DRAFT_23584 [Aspergillus campestris IBT 28561]PKY08821.1 hypothetical protein P168DRAFT_23584 [Aspergillus campestris IBT 28561]